MSADKKPFPHKLPVLPPKAIAIGSSTGGPQTLNNIFRQLSGRLPKVPIFITQHMPPIFTAALAEQISTSGGRSCVEGKSGTPVAEDGIYLAPGDYHMTVEAAPGAPVIQLNQDPPENFCRPSVDVMLRSLSQVYGSRMMVVILTGMGQDGMLGTRLARENGAMVVAQNQESSVVWGMPKAVVENNLAVVVIPDSEIAEYILACYGLKP